MYFEVNRHEDAARERGQGGTMNLYRVEFGFATYYVVADCATSAFAQAIDRLEDAKAPWMREVTIRELCSMDRLILDALDEKRKPEPSDTGDK